MKFLQLLSLLIFISGCTTVSMWENTIDDTHNRKIKSDLTPAQFNQYKAMSATNSAIQIDPVTEEVHVKKQTAERFGNYAIATLFTPVTLIVDITLISFWLILNDELDIDSDRQHNPTLKRAVKVKVSKKLIR